MEAFKSAILAIIGKSQVLIQVDNLRRLPRLGYAIGPLWDLLAQPCLMVKVSKSQKQFLVFSITPKNERKTGKNILRAFRIFFVFCSFLEELRIPKNAFEI